MRVHLHVFQGREAPHVITLDAGSPQEATTLAKAQGYVVLSATQGDGRQHLALPSLLGKRATAVLKLSSKDITILVEQLQSLLQAGLSVIEALDTLQKGASSPRNQQAIEQLSRALKEGQPLSTALERKGLFPALLVALIRSSEVTSDLPQALYRYLEHEKRSSQVRHQIKSVALYPALLIGVGGAVMLFLLLYVMPRFARVFESMNNLPWSASLMVSWSHLLKNHGAELFMGMVGLVAGAVTLFLTPQSRAFITQKLMAWGPLARHLRVYFLARWYRTTGMLVQGGLPLPEAVGLSSQVLPSGMRQAGLLVEQAMRQGLAPSAAYTQGQLATPVAEQLIQAGERTGDVGLMLKRAAEFHENEVTRTLDNAMRVIEPVVMTVIGLGVGIVVILMYLPIFELASAIQ